MSSNVDVTNQYCGTKWRCSHSNGSFTLRRQWQIKSIFSVFRCRQSVNTTICYHCYHDTHFFRCRCRYKKVQNPFHDDTKIMINMLLSPQCEWAVKTCSHCNGNGILFIILVLLPLPSWMGSIPIHDSNGNGNNCNGKWKNGYHGIRWWCSHGVTATATKEIEFSVTIATAPQCERTLTTF